MQFFLSDVNLSDVSIINLIEMLWLPCCIQLVALIVGMIINRFISRNLRQHLATPDSSLKNIFIHAVHGTPVTLCSLIGLRWTIQTLDMTPVLFKILHYATLAVIIYTITRIIARTLVGMVDVHTSKTENMPKTSLLTNIINIFIYALGILVLLQSYDISITPILTALGVGGMAVALALQDTLANIFAGIYLILSKQIRIGDYVKLDSGQEGSVTDITWRFTSIQSIRNNVIVVPNKNISTAVITNYNMPHPEITIVIPVGVSYDSDLEQVERVTLEVANETMLKLGEDISFEPTVRFHTFGESSIDFNVSMRSSQFTNQFLLKHEFIKALTKRYREEGINIPYPIRTILQN
jgi:small-conductance mechanosensitive channel